ncbi:hypothetical protein QO034_14790 [Sedimentitalea sp. JM2-8]|uniref:Histidinol phosphate aminotransferase n=1 Tax=Sedimentitalea xiamensis TaxID=3050037 RepID=A0ABT7FH14_9RHOB|nr:hypothetical protein [Sedimentitalea xiamensis]MDK3074368.1 hypothetical protein [Sedimentitalea xiamensis]
MSERRLTPAPNYTNAALIMLGVNLTWVFVTIWAMFGLIPVLLLATAINHLIHRKAARTR